MAAGAVEGWKDGDGAVRDGQTGGHAFEATGSHEYDCVPHGSPGAESGVVED